VLCSRPQSQLAGDTSILTSCTSVEILSIGVDSGYPQGSGVNLRKKEESQGGQKTNVGYNLQHFLTTMATYRYGNPDHRRQVTVPAPSNGERVRDLQVKNHSRFNSGL
jgi:hypothetical protein